MQIEVNKDELAVILDGLAALPLARSFNVFNKLLAVINQPAPPQPQDPPLQGLRMPPLPDTPPNSGGP